MLLPVSSGDERYTQNPSYIQLGDELGYVFLSSANVRVLQDDRGDNKDMLNVSIEHGQQPVDEEYAYVLLPMSDREQTAAYAKDPDIEILEQTNKIHAIRHIPSKKIAANLFEPCSFYGIDFDRACSVIMMVDNDIYDIYISDPTQTIDNTITLTFPCNVSVSSDEEGIYSVNNSITVEVWRRYGGTFHLTAMRGD